MARPVSRLRLAVLAGAAGLTLAGCGGDGGSDGPITLQVFGDPEETRVYKEIAAAYKKQGGGQVEVIEVADRKAHQQKLTTGFGSGNPPDAFLVNYRNFGGFADRGVLDPVGPRLQASDVLDAGAFYSQAMDAFAFEGQLRCMPQNVSSLVVYYNRDAFREAGLEDPAGDWTYTDLIAAATKLKDADRDRDALGVEGEIIKLAPFVWSAGGELVDDEQNPTGFTLDSPEARAGVRAFFRLAQFSPTDVEVESRPVEERFISGQLAMLMSSRRDVPLFRTIKEFDWDVAPFPPLTTPATILHSDAYCISKGEGADGAWRFVEFAAGPEGQRIAARGGRTVPSLRSVAESADFLNPKAKPASSQVFLDAIPAIRRVPNTPSWSLVEDAGNMVTEEAFFEAPAAESLREVAEEYARNLNRATASAFRGGKP